MNNLPPSPWPSVLTHCLTTISIAANLASVVSRISGLEVIDAHVIIHPKAPTIVILPNDPGDESHLTLLKQSLDDLLPLTKFVPIRSGDFWKLRATTENDICIEINTIIPHSKPVDLKP